MPSSTTFNKEVIGRIGANILLVLLIASGNWWMILIVACIFLFIYRIFYEIVLWGICFDSLYASPVHGPFDIHTHIALIVAIFLLIGATFLKKNLSLYS